MPKVFEWNGYRFHFFANEGDPREPVHIHVSSAGAKAKFWLYPQVELAIIGVTTLAQSDASRKL